MASEKPESGGFLAIIDAKIAALQQLRESLIAAMAIGALGGDIDLSQFSAGATGVVGATGAPSKGPIELPTGVFRGQGLSDAIRMYLAMAKRKRTNQEIKAALMEGGLATTSEYFDQTLSSTLHRMRKNGELLQFREGWDLAEWYPDSFRQRMAEGKELAGRGGAKKKRRKKPQPSGKAPARAANGPPKLLPAKAESGAEASDGRTPILRAV